MPHTSITRMAALIFSFVLVITLTACGAAPGEGVRQADYTAAAEYNQAASDVRNPEVLAEIPAKSTGPLDPSGFVLLSEAVPDVILEIRYYSTYNFVGDRITGYEEPVALLTREAAAALQEVSDELIQQGYRLKIYDAYRPQSAVEQFKAWALDGTDTRMKQYFYPDLDKSVLFAQGYIASKSGHSRGSAVDLTLFDMAAGRDADMGGTFDYFGASSHSDYTVGLTNEQIERRTLLKDAMLAHGFKAIQTEWWHFVLEHEPYPDTYFNFPVTSLE